MHTKDVYYLVEVHLCDLTYHRCLADPLPMKQRALPQSFWQQPNKANPQPPGVVYSNLPPLPLGGDEASEITPVEEVSNGGDLARLVPSKREGTRRARSPPWKKSATAVRGLRTP